MDHRVRVAEAFAKRVANGDLSDNRIVDRIHHQQAFGVDGTARALEPTPSASSAANAFGPS